MRKRSYFAWPRSNASATAFTNTACTFNGMVRWLLARKPLEQCLGHTLRRGRVLPGDQMAVLDHMTRPVRSLGILATLAFEHVLDQKRHHLGQPDGVFLAVGETGHLLALDHRMAIRCIDMLEHARCMADCGNRLVGCVKSFQQRLRIVVLGQVPQRPWPPG